MFNDDTRKTNDENVCLQNSDFNLGELYTVNKLVALTSSPLKLIPLHMIQKFLLTQTSHLDAVTKSIRINKLILQ